MNQFELYELTKYLYVRVYQSLRFSLAEEELCTNDNG